MTWLIVAMMFEAMSFLITSTGLTDSFSARSFTDRLGGSSTRRSPLGAILTATDADLNGRSAVRQRQLDRRRFFFFASGQAALRGVNTCSAVEEVD